jgi:hypothetical protein
VANIQFVKCITLFVGPLLYALFVHDSTKHEQWAYIFLIISLSQLIVSKQTIAFPYFKSIQATVLFLIYSTDEPQEFTKLSKNSKANKTEVEQTDGL